MGRIKLHGAIRKENLGYKGDFSMDLTDGNLGKDATSLGTFEKLNLSNSDFLITRRKVKLNAKKRRLLIKLTQIKAQAKSERILQLRKEKLEKFRIDYIPLGSEEDWEMMAEFYSKNSKK